MPLPERSWTPEQQQEMFTEMARHLLLKLDGKRDLSILIMDAIDEFANFTDFKTTVIAQWQPPPTPSRIPSVSRRPLTVVGGGVNHGGVSSNLTIRSVITSLVDKFTTTYGPS